MKTRTVYLPIIPNGYREDGPSKSFWRSIHPEHEIEFIETDAVSVEVENSLVVQEHLRSVGREDLIRPLYFEEFRPDSPPLTDQELEIVLNQGSKWPDL